KEKEIDKELQSVAHNSQLSLEIEQLHVYNDIKDAAQVVLGKLANLKGATGKAKQAKLAMQKYAKMKKMISSTDARIKNKKPSTKKKPEDPHKIEVREVPQASSALFFQYNTQLGPPYHILVDTNFINHSIRYKLDIIQNMMDCLYAKCIPYITDCVLGEIEKMGTKFSVALKIIKDPRFERIRCLHKGTYADDCLVQRVTQVFHLLGILIAILAAAAVSSCFTSEYIGIYTIERMPDAYGAPKV
ncbi:rRNA-processing protein FCF1 homolog-like Protein, partial [Gryllus bimaculatus]